MRDNTENPIVTDQDGNQVSSEYVQAQDSKGIDNPTTEVAVYEQEQEAPTDPSVIDPAKQIKQTEDKKDWIETRILTPYISVEDLDTMYGAKGFRQFKHKDQYWENEEIKKMFVESYGSDAKYEFNKAYDLFKKEFAQFELGNFMKSKSGYELIRDDLSDLSARVVVRRHNPTRSLMEGSDWGAQRQDMRQNFNKIRYRDKDENGETIYKTEDYSPELLEKLEEDGAFSGLAYSDAGMMEDPYAPTDGGVYEAIYEGKILGSDGKTLVDVRNDQVVSQWDIETGSIFDGWFNNNKLEADGFLDYAKILVRAPTNMVFNLMDTGIQLTRASIALGYGLIDKVTADKINVEDSVTYRALTTYGIKTKKHVTSTSSEAMRDGFFGSLESALMTTADIALQVALAGALGKLASKAAKISLPENAGYKAIVRAQTRASKVMVRGTLTAMATKDAYNEALENGYSTTEAAIITGAIAFGMWQATSYASYILGDYDVKKLRGAIRNAIKKDHDEIFGAAVKAAAERAVTKAVGEKGKEEFSKLSIQHAKRVIDKIFGKTHKALNYNRWIYEAKQEALEEMSEELAQDLVQHGASAYGTLLNNAKEAGKGRYMTFMDEGWFQHAAERYATSGVAGGLGGITGMSMMHRANVSDITDTSSITEIILAGKGHQLIETLDQLKAEGQLGPSNLAAEYNFDLGIFEPMVENSDADSLSDMVYNTYLQDINVINTFVNKGMFGNARMAMEAQEELKDAVNNNAMRKDFANLVGNIIDFHSKTGITTKVYEEMDKLDNGELTKYMPDAVMQMQADIKKERERVEAMRADLNKRKAKLAAPDAEEDTDGKIKIIPKEDDKNDITKEEFILTKLEAAVEESKQLEEKHLHTMLYNYKKLRAIASGASAEHYLLQNEVAFDPILGSEFNRDAEFKNLGAEPLKDMLFAMRFRVLDDRKDSILRDKAAYEIEAEVLNMSSMDEATTKRLLSIVKDSADLLTDKGIAHINALYDKTTFKEVGDLFDVNNPNSIFEKGPDGKATKASINQVFKDIIATNKSNSFIVNNPDYKKLVEDKGIPEKFFKEVVANPKEASISTYSFYYDDDYIKTMSEGKNKGALLDVIQEAPEYISTAVDTVVKPSDSVLRGVAQDINSRKSSYITEGPSKHPLKTILRGMEKGKLTSGTLLSTGLGEVKSLLDTAIGDAGDIYTYTKSEPLKKVVSQIKIKDALARTLSNFVGTDTGSKHLANMMVQFRKNVLDIINFKYEFGAIPNTRIENHPYKEYTVASDFFVDFMFDPIALGETLEKDKSLHTEEDRINLKRYEEARQIVQDVVVDLDTGEESYRKDLDYDKLNQFLLMKFNNLSTRTDISNAITFLESGTATQLIEVPGDTEGDPPKKVELKIDNITALRLSKFLFDFALNTMEDITNGVKPLPYVEAKEKDIEAVFNVYRDIMGTGEPFSKYLGEQIRDIIPDIDNIVADPDSISKIELGKINIQLEKALYDIYNKNSNIVFKESPEYDKANLSSDIDFYIQSVVDKSTGPQDVSANVRARKSATILIGAVTTDFSPFYSRFKKALETMTETDPILIAGQEHTAKYMSAYIYSEAFKDYADNSFKGAGNGYVKAIFGSGTAGSGKSSATTNVGVSIGIDILETMGVPNTAVIPISNNEAQINIISKSVGALAKDKKGMTPEELEETLRLAVVEEDEKAIESLKNVGAIIIDEATYVSVKPNPFNQKIGTLKNIDILLQKYNTNYIKKGEHTISLILLGDSKQSGYTYTGNKHVHRGGIDSSQLFSLSYMDFSFRNRNSLLTSSLRAISQSKSSLTLSNLAVSELAIQKGLKYGRSGERMYGINMYNANDVDSMADFMKVMNDDTVIGNIIQNIKKVKENNKGLQPDDPNYQKFSVLISPESEQEFMEQSSAMKTQLIENDEYSSYISIVPYSEIGGSEANYLFAELPKYPFGEEVVKNRIYYTELHKALNTVATRAFDYAHIVNRAEGVNIPSQNRSEEITEAGEIIIPDSNLDKAAKDQVKSMYLDILADLQGDGMVRPPEPNTPPPDSEPLTIPEDMSKAQSEAIDFFIKGNYFNFDKLRVIQDKLSMKGKLNYINVVSSLKLLVSSDNDTILANSDQAKAAIESLRGELTDIEINGLFYLAESIRITNIDDHFESRDLLSALDLGLYVMSDTIYITEQVGKKSYPDTELGIDNLISEVQDKLANEPYEDYDEIFSLALGAFNSKEFDAEIEALIDEVIKENDEINGQFAGALTDDELKYVRQLIKDSVQYYAYVRGGGFNYTQTVKPELTDENDAAVIGFTVWMNSMWSSNDVYKVIQELERLKGLTSMTREEANLDDLGNAKKLFKVYTPESVLNTLSEAADRVYKKMLKEEAEEDPDTEENEEENLYKEFDTIKSSMGIDSSIKAKGPLRRAIENKEAEIARSGSDNDRLKVARLRELWDLLYAASPDESFTGKVSFYNRGINEQDATLEDYIERRGKESGYDHIYTGTIYDNTAKNYLVTHSFDKNTEYKVYDKQEDALALFDYDKTTPSGSTPSRFGLRAIKFKSGHIGVFVVAMQGRTKHIISQFLLPNGKIPTAEQASKDTPLDLLQTIEGVLNTADPSITNKHGENVFYDVEIEGNIKEFLMTRAGSAARATMNTGISLAELRDKGINVTSHVYAHTDKTGSMTKHKLSGKLYLVYSNNKSIDLKNEGIRKDNLDGSVVHRGKTIVDTTGALNSEIEIMAVSIEPDFVRLSEALKNINGEVLSEFPSYLSMLIQRHLGSQLGNSTTTQSGEYEPLVLSIGGETRTAIITKPLVDRGSQMYADYETHVKSIDGLETILEEKYNELMADPKTKQTMDSLASALIYSMSLTPKKQLSFLYKKAGTEAYTLGINKVIKYGDPELLNMLSELALVTGFVVRPTISAGKTVRVGLINDIFVNELADIMTVPTTGIEQPKFIITKAGKSALMHAVKSKKKSTGGTKKRVRYDQTDRVVLDRARGFNAGTRTMFKQENQKEALAAASLINQAELLLEKIKVDPSKIADKVMLESKIAELNLYVKTLKAPMNIPGIKEGQGDTFYEAVFQEPGTKDNMDDPRAILLGDIFNNVVPADPNSMKQVVAGFRRSDKGTNPNDILDGIIANIKKSRRISEQAKSKDIGALEAAREKCSINN